MSDFELAFRPASDLAALIRSRRISPVELLEQTTRLVEQAQERLNCFHTLFLDQAMAEARIAEAKVMRGEGLGVLHGVPTAIKDLTPVRGVRTTYGSKLFSDYVPDDDGLVVTRLRGAGAIVIGKTATPEFGHKAVTESDLFGVTRNPWALERTPGGSSGGAAAVVAAGALSIAHGTDGAGSIRIPASFCGLVGLKPTFARVARWPQPDAFQTNSHDGPIGRTVQDVALMLEAMAGADRRDPFSIGHKSFSAAAALEMDMPRVRIGWSPDFGSVAVGPEVRRVVGEATSAWPELGFQLVPVEPNWDDPGPVVTAVFHSGLVRVLLGQPDDAIDRVDESFRQALEFGLGYTVSDLAEASKRRTAFFQKIVELFDNIDLLVTPTCPEPAGLLHGASGGPGLGESIRFVSPFNLTGNPAITVPAGWTAAGLPVGMQIVGPRGNDELVIRAAAAFEAARPWHSRRPTGQFGGQ